MKKSSLVLCDKDDQHKRNVDFEAMIVIPLASHNLTLQRPASARVVDTSAFHYMCRVHGSSKTLTSYAVEARGDANSPASWYVWFRQPQLYVAAPSVEASITKSFSLDTQGFELLLAFQDTVFEPDEKDGAAWPDLSGRIV